MNFNFARQAVAFERDGYIIIENSLAPVGSAKSRVRLGDSKNTEPLLRKRSHRRVECRHR